MLLLPPTASEHVTLPCMLTTYFLQQPSIMETMPHSLSSPALFPASLTRSCS